MYEIFCKHNFVEDINKVQWDRVNLINYVEKALELFTKMFLEEADNHAASRKFTVVILGSKYNKYEIGL